MLKNIWEWFLWFTGVTDVGWSAWWADFSAVCHFLVSLLLFDED